MEMKMHAHIGATTMSDDKKHRMYRILGSPLHGNNRRSRRFYELRPGDFFICSVEEYSKYCSARSYFQKIMRERYEMDITVSSQAVTDSKGVVVGYKFIREA